MKLYGSVVDVTEPESRRRYGDVLLAAIDWRPSEPFHLFALDVREAGMIVFGTERRAMRWDEAHGVAELHHPDA